MIDSKIGFVCAIIVILNRATGLQMFFLLHIAYLVAWKDKASTFNLLFYDNGSVLVMMGNLIHQIIREDYVTLKT